MWRTPATLRGHARRRPRRRSPPAIRSDDPRARDELRRHLRRGARRRRRLRSQRRLQPGRARPLRRRRARDRLAPPPRAGQRGGRRRAGHGRRDARRRRPGRRHPGPGAGRRAADRRSRRRKALAAARGLPLAPVDHLQGHVAANFLGRSRSSRRSCAWSPRAATRCSRASTDHDGYETLGATLDDAAGEAFDKGARHARPRLPGRPGAVEARRWTATRPRSRSRSPRRVAGLDFSFAGAQDRAALRGARPGGGRPRAAPPTSPPPTSTRSSRR